MPRIVFTIRDGFEKGEATVNIDVKGDRQNRLSPTPSDAEIVAAAFQRLWQSGSLTHLIPLLCQDLLAIRRHHDQAVEKAKGSEGNTPGAGLKLPPGFAEKMRAAAFEQQAKEQGAKGEAFKEKVVGEEPSAQKIKDLRERFEVEKGEVFKEPDDPPKLLAPRAFVAETSEELVDAPASEDAPRPRARHRAEGYATVVAEAMIAAGFPDPRADSDVLKDIPFVEEPPTGA